MRQGMMSISVDAASISHDIKRGKYIQNIIN